MNRIPTEAPRLRRAFVGLTAMVVLTASALTVVPTELCTTDIHCAEMHGVDLYGNPYPPKEN